MVKPHPHVYAVPPGEHVPDGLGPVRPGGPGRVQASPSRLNRVLTFLFNVLPSYRISSFRYKWTWDPREKGTAVAAPMKVALDRLREARQAAVENSASRQAANERLPKHQASDLP